jgi:hypothetical protein
MKRKSTNQPQGKPTKRLALPRALVASPFVPPRQVRVPAARALGEKKGMDTSISFAQIPSTVNDNSGMIVLNLIQQGAGSWNRVGRKVNLRSIRIRGEITHTQTTASGNTFGQTVRCVVVWDKQPSSGTIPQWQDMFGFTAQDGTEGTSMYAPIRYDNMDRFSILRDVTYDPQPGAKSGNPDIVYYYNTIDEYIRLGDRECVFSGQSNPMTIADISTGAIYFCIRAKNNNISSTYSSVTNMTARLRYTDL